MNDTYLLHRYIKKKQDKHLFRGDALYTYEVAETKDVVGIVSSFTSDKKTVKTSDLSYRIKLRFRLLLKSLKLFLRRVIKGK